MKLYILKKTYLLTQKSNDEICYDADVFNPLTSTEDAEREINVNNISGSLTESVAINNINEMTPNKFVHYQSTIINPIYSVTIEEARESQ